MKHPQRHNRYRNKDTCEIEENVTSFDVHHVRFFLLFLGFLLPYTSGNFIFLFQVFCLLFFSFFFLLPFSDILSAPFSPHCLSLPLPACVADVGGDRCVGVCILAVLLVLVLNSWCLSADRRRTAGAGTRR